LIRVRDGEHAMAKRLELRPPEGLDRLDLDKLTRKLLGLGLGQDSLRLPCRGHLPD